MVKVLPSHEIDTVEMRDAYCQTLIETAKKDPRVVMVNCDLCSSMGLKPFANMFPDRSFNVGIQEANGCGMAAGMSAAGLIPFFNTFAIFATRRICDQVFISCAYAGLNVKIIGGDAGVSATYNGGTHMAFEDIGIMRSIPTMTIIEPSDAVMMKSLVKQLAEKYGVFYMRMPRKNMARIYEEGSDFVIGKAALVRDGGDVSIIASGMLVIEAIRAADILASQGIMARVVDMFTIKPIDTDCIIKCAKETGAIVTVENSNIIGGLGSAVAETLAETIPVPIERVGVRDQFGEVGQQEELKEKFGLTAPYIVEAVKRVLNRKRLSKQLNGKGVIL